MGINEFEVNKQHFLEFYKRNDGMPNMHNTKKTNNFYFQMKYSTMHFIFRVKILTYIVEIFIWFSWYQKFDLSIGRNTYKFTILNECSKLFRSNLFRG